MKINEDLIIGNTNKSLKSFSDNLDKLNLPHLTKLWENSKPSDSFSGQQITLNSDDYDFLIFMFRFEVSTIINVVSNFCLKGQGVVMGIGWDYNGGSGNTYYNAGFRRTATRASDTSYTMSDCYVRYGNNTSNNVVNNKLIPLVILGGKF